MKLLLIVMLSAALVAAAPKQESDDLTALGAGQDKSNQQILIDILIQQLTAHIRRLMRHGSEINNLPPFDPLDLDYYHLKIPAGIINVDIKLTNLYVTGMSDFVVHEADLKLPELSLYIDATIPRLDLTSEHYDLTGDFLTALPVLGNGRAEIVMENFRFTTKLFLKKSDNGKSIVVDKIENASFHISSLKSNFDGAMGGGDIDHVVNAVIEQVLVGYFNRFQGALSQVTARGWIKIGNPLLEQYDSWRYLEQLL